MYRPIRVVLEINHLQRLQYLRVKLFLLVGNIILWLKNTFGKVQIQYQISSSIKKSEIQVSLKLLTSIFRLLTFRKVNRRVLLL
ncbi:hypothetical protein [Flavobacterium sp. LMO8]|uniref:hypothetical protein n=1 Tax=Flavobacterium sp. LMO8 TaxID=2654244 RepID=UPI00351AF0A9